MAVAAIKGEKTVIKLAQDFDLHPNQIKQWHDQLLEDATQVLGDGPKVEPGPVINAKILHVKIGELTLENIFCQSRWQGSDLDRHEDRLNAPDAERPRR